MLGSLCKHEIYGHLAVIRNLHPECVLKDSGANLLVGAVFILYYPSEMLVHGCLADITEDIVIASIATIEFK